MKITSKEQVYTQFKGIGGLEIDHYNYSGHYCSIEQLIEFFKNYIDRKFHTITNISSSNRLNIKIIFDRDDVHHCANITSEVADLIKRQVMELDFQFKVRKIYYKELMV